MDDWVLWLILAVVFAIGEIATLGFFLAPFAGGAAVAALVSAAGGGFVVSLAIFLAISAVLLASLRPLARAHLKLPARLRTGTAALIGRPATVVERITTGEGCVKIDGEVWTARAYMDEETFEPGARVHVMEIRGATALVSE